MPTVLPGFAFITGVFGCFNHRVLDPVHKPKTITFDAEIPMGDNPEGVLQCAKGVLHYFVPSHETPPEDDRKFFVSGKVVSVSSGGGDDYSSMDYDLQIEALTVRPFLTSFPLAFIIVCSCSSFLLVTLMTLQEVRSLLQARYAILTLL